MYCMNNMVVVSHGCLFIHLDLGIPGFFHDVIIFCHSNFYKHWHAHCIHGDRYFEYLLGDPSCIDVYMFIMWRFGNVERSLDMDEVVLIACNKIHASYNGRVEWGIGGFEAQTSKTHKAYWSRNHLDKLHALPYI